jgi:hypothetical protein
MTSVPATDIGAAVKVVQSVPNVNAGATLNGAAIDRMLTTGGNEGYYSCVLTGGCGAATGTPTTQTYDVKLQDSADGSTGWADFTDEDGNGAITQITADDTNGTTGNVNLKSAKGFIRFVEIVAFTGGTSPDIPHACNVVLGGARVLPAT